MSSLLLKCLTETCGRFTLLNMLLRLDWTAFLLVQQHNGMARINNKKSPFYLAPDHCSCHEISRRKRTFCAINLPYRWTSWSVNLCFDVKLSYSVKNAKYPSLLCNSRLCTSISDLLIYALHTDLKTNYSKLHGYTVNY